MIEHAYKDLYNQDSVDKQISIVFDSGEITNTDLYSESFELKESLCSQSELHFGSCEASVLKIKIRNEFGELKNKWLDVSEVLNGNSDIPFKIGRYKVYSDEPSGDRKYTNITAYDAMYDVINADVAEWYESLTFPISLKEFRDSLFSYLGITQEETTLILDELSIEKTISATSISGKDIIAAICELNGVFGHINRQGNFIYVSLADKTGLYPSAELYPSNALFPITGPYDANCPSETLGKNRYISCEYEDFNTSFISKLQIRQEENDIGAIVGDGTNTYIIEDNFLVYGKEPEELSEIASKIFEKIKLVQYRPMKAVLKGNPCLEVGDAVIFHTRYKDVEGYILERTLKGIQSLKDTFESKGVYEYKEKVNSVQKEVKKLKGKTNVLERTVEELKSTITDVNAGLQTQIEQSADKISAVVLKQEGNDEDIANLKEQVQATMTSEQITIEIQKQISEGTTKVKTNTGFTFDDDGLSIKKSDSKIETHITNEGMRVQNNTNAESLEDVLIADKDGVVAKDLHAKSFLIIGTNSRFEDYGSNRTGCFWIGG